MKNARGRLHSEFIFCPAQQSSVIKLIFWLVRGYAVRRAGAHTWHVFRLNERIVELPPERVGTRIRVYVANYFDLFVPNSAVY